jgi:hypothetical protein
VNVEPHVLEAALGMPVVPMVATKNQGVRELVETVMRVHREGVYGVCRPDIRDDHREVLSEIGTLIAGSVPEPYPEDWAALKLPARNGIVKGACRCIRSGPISITGSLKPTRLTVWSASKCSFFTEKFCPQRMKNSHDLHQGIFPGRGRSLCRTTGV